MTNFSTDELHIVQRWLSAEQEKLYNARMKIECGDDFAATNKKWPRVVELSDDQLAVNVQQKRVQKQLISAYEIEWGVEK